MKNSFKVLKGVINFIVSSNISCVLVFRFRVIVLKKINYAFFNTNITITFVKTKLLKNSDVFGFSVMLYIF